MKNRSITFRLVTFTLITAFVALAAITATASSETRFAFIDQVREFIGYAPTSQSVTTAPTELNSAEPMFFAGELLQWNTFGNAGTETTEPSILNDANIAATNLTQGTITAAGNANRFGGSNWWNTGNSASNTIAEAVAGNDYIQFVVTPNAGFSFTPTSFVFNWDKSGTGPQNVALRSSADGFASNLGTVAPTASIATANTITISGLNNLTTATTFRLYGYGATATTGTGGFDIGTNVPNVTLFGTTAAVAVDHTVTFDANGGTGSMSPQVASTATNLTSNGFTRTGYTFAGWNTLAGGGGTSYANTASYDFSADLTLYAQWTVSTYTITATSGANGTVTPAGTTVVNYGDNLTYTMTADPGYEVDVLTVDGSPVPAATTYPYINVSADHTINATYKLKDVIISSATGMPGGTYGNVTINSCDTVSLGGDVVIVGTMTVASCQGLDTNGHIVSGSGAFTLGAGGTLVVSDPGGISASGATGSIQVLGTRTFPTTAFYRFFGDVNGIVGNGLPTTVAGLTIECNACTVTGNNVASPGQVVTGTLNIISGNYVGHSDYNDVVIEAAGTLTLTDATTVSGNWTNNGGTLAGNFTVTFDGGGAQSVTGSTSFYGLAFAPGARTITFQAGSTQTATNSFAANGTSGNLITMVSSSSPTQWSISAPATAVSYLDVKDSNATSGLITATHSVNAAPGTTNTNWLFNYTLSYDGNGNSGGTAPTSVTQAASSTTTVSGAGSLVKNSDHFVRWNTAANGSGSDFNAGSTFTFTGDTTLYAQWLAACPAGKYFNGTGCVDASPGYYVPTSGQTEQTLCAAGTYQPNAGSAGCNDADAGYYVATEGSETQTECEVGKYQDLTGQSSCKNATPGHFVSTTGAITQTDTPAGTSIPGSNATAAGAQCIAGTYQDLPGQASCKPADVNYYVPAAGATEQLPCPVGTSSAGAATQCTLNNYTVTYDGNSPSSGTAPTSPGSGDYNTTIVLPGAGDLLKTGYSFGGWNTLANGTGTNYAAGANYTIPATNSTLYAKWNATTFTLTATTGGNGNFKFGNVLANGATTVNPGESRTYRIVPDFGYQVADVLVDSVSVGKGQSYTFTNVQADHTISATFEAVTNRTLTAGTLNSYYDAVIDVPITVSDTTGANITSFDFSLSYDETKLEPVISSGTNVTITNGTLGTWSGNVVKAATGIINVSRFSASTPASGAGVLIYIKMHVKAHATTTAALTLDGTYLGGSYGAFAPFNGGAVGANAAVAGVVNINPTATTTSVVTSGTPSTYGNSVTFTATVTTGGTPAVSGGSVTFYDGGTCGTPGTALGAAVNIDVNGVAAISTAALFAGNHTIVACYGGTSDFTASSGSVAQVVNKRAVTVTAVADTKTYDGNTSSAGVPTISPALISGDTSSFIQTYDTRNAGTGKTLTPSGTISDGNSGNNYDITFTPVTTGVINKLAVTVTAVTDTKTYDGSTSSAGVPTVSPAVISPDSGTFVQTFDTRDAGTGKTLTPSGSIDDGNSGNNYTITFTGVNTGVINKLAVTVTAVAATKTYDGGTSSAGVPTVSPAIISPDAGTFIQTYDTRDTGTGKTLTPSGSIDDANGGNNYTITFTAVTTGVINKLAVTVTAVAATKTYDGNTSSAGLPTVSPAIIAPDSGSFIQTYDTRDAGTGKTLTPSGTISDGNGGNNYTITFTAVTTGVINKLGLTVTAVTDTKTYDGSTSSVGVPTVSPALISPDSGSFSQTYDNRNAGTGKTLTPTGTITDGNGGNNYTVNYVSVNTGVINKLAITVTAVAATKTYDGSTSSAGVPTVSPAVISPDVAGFVQTYDNRNAGTGKTLTPSGSVNDGNSGGNYDVTFNAVTTGVINKLALSVTAVASTKAYDGSTSSAGVPTVSPAVISPDVAGFVQTYDTRNAGTGKTLTPSGSINDGNSGGNYDITFNTVNTGEITKLAVTVTAVADTKTYDGSTSSVGIPTVSPALISPDAGTFVQTFDNRNAGTGKTLTPSGTINDGNSGGNYDVTFTAVNTGVINKLAVTVTAVTDTKTYDGSTSSVGVPTVSPALISPDAGSFVQTFDNRNAGTGKTLTPSGSIADGNGGGNYTIAFTAVTTGVINKLAITVTAVTSTKTYDGNTSSAGIPTASPAVIAPDVASFVQTYDDRNAGTGKTLTPSGSIDDGNSGGNYTITFTAVNTGVINKLAITVTAVTSTKTYDGNASSTGVPTVSPALISPDSGSFSQAFDTANAGTNKTLTPTGTITDGNSGNNYTVTYTAVTTGTINRADASCTVTGYTVAYDGNAHLATGSCLGVLGETLAGLDLSGTSHINAGTFIDTWTFTDVTGNYNDTSGQVTDTITAGTVNGTILYYGGANDPVSNVLVSGAGSLPVSGTSNGLGYYTIPGFGSGSYTMTPTRAMQLCDTQNGVLIDDAALVSEYVVGLTSLSTTQKLAAKVSGTATANLSSFDAALIAQKSVGICDSPNIAGRWGFAPGTYVHNPVTTHTDNYTAYLMGDVNGDWSSSAVPNVANRESLSPNAVRASLPVGNAQPGTEVTVPFRIDNLNGQSLNSYQFSVAYDPAVIAPADESANVDGTLSGNLNAVYNTPTPGMLRVGVYGAFPTQGDGVYVNLKFRVVGSNGSSSPLTISGFRFNHGTDEVTSVHGRITVGVAAADATLQGRVLAMGGRGVTGARVTATSGAGVVKTGFTTRYGQFIISGLTIGETYTVAVQSRRFVFVPRSVPISDSVTNVDFVAEQ